MKDVNRTVAAWRRSGARRPVGDQASEPPSRIVDGIGHRLSRDSRETCFIDQAAS